MQDVIAVRAMTQIPKNPVNTHYYTLLLISQSLSPIWLPELWITKWGSKLIYKSLPAKRVVYVLPITSILRRLPVVRAGDTGIIQLGYRSGCCNGAHSYNHYLTSADSSRGAEDSCPMYFVNSWVLAWSSDSWTWQRWFKQMGWRRLPGVGSGP